MDDTCGQSLPPFLAPVESSRECDEYRLVGEPACLQEIIDFLHAHDERAIWTSPNACITSSAWSQIAVPANFHAQGGHVGFEKNTMGYKFLKIQARSHGDKLDCFAFLLRISDAYDSVKMSSFGPISSSILKLLLNGKPGTTSISFVDEQFSADCGRLLATGGSGIRLQRFMSCSFEDGGKAFVNALSRRRDEREGPSKMMLNPNKLFDAENRHKFFLLLQQASLQNFSLSLNWLTALDEEATRLLALARIRMLELRCVRMSDGGEELAASIRRGHGPRGLCIYDSLDALIKVLDAVGDERCSVEKLIIENCTLDGEILAAALQGNKRLCHLKLRGLQIKTQTWKQVLGAISTHPTLRSLRLFSIKSSEDEVSMNDVVLEEVKKQRTKDVIAMLTTNHHLDDIEFCPTTFNQVTWNDGVAPMLECNRWRKNGRRLWRVEPESTRASLLAMCLAQVSSNPSTINLLLSSNQGLIASYLRGPLSDRAILLGMPSCETLGSTVVVPTL